MSKLYADITMSLDGYVAGPNINPEQPLGERGEHLHDWALDLASWRESHGRSGGRTGADDEVMKKSIARGGAVIMGKNMFGPGDGAPPDDGSWKGWWGDDPPFRTPVFVLTHHPRPSFSLSDTTFHFIDAAPADALRQAMPGDDG